MEPDLDKDDLDFGGAWKANPVGWSTATWAIPEGENSKETWSKARDKYLKWAKSDFLENPYCRDFPYDTIDIYRVLQVYEVTDPCIQHAVKKLLCAGQRGYKEVEKDVQEAIQSLQRWEEMRREESCN